MWILKSDAQQAIFNEINARLPAMLLQLGIHISVASTNELSNLIKENVTRHYFPTKSHDLARVFMYVICFPLAIYDMMAQNLVSISPNCSNEELRAITYDQQRALESALNYQIITNYRDLEQEARVAEENKARSSSGTTAPSCGPKPR